MRDRVATARRECKYSFTTVRTCMEIHVSEGYEEAGLDRMGLGYIGTGIDGQIPLGCQ